MYRLLFIFVTLLWLTAMSALIMRDVWPAWTAQDPPHLTAAQFADEDRQEQFAIFDGQGNRLGTAWGEIGRGTGDVVVMTGTILIDGIAQLPIPAIRIESETQFDTAGELDSFNLDVYGVPMTPISVKGERRGIYFPCELKIGPIERQASLDVSASRMIGESIRPFNILPNLRVGQSWRMQLLDPVAAVISNRTEFRSVVARVTGRETIASAGGSVDCFVVEVQDQTKAWVTTDGRVIRQIVNSPIPVIGKLRVEAEAYNEAALKQAKDRVRMSGRSPDRGRNGNGD